MSGTYLVAICRTPSALEKVLEMLKASGGAATDVSIIAKVRCDEESPAGFYDIGEGPQYLGKNQDFWQDVWDQRPRKAILTLTAGGPLILSGPVVSWVLETVANGSIERGFSAIGSTLLRLGLPEQTVFDCSHNLREYNKIVVSTGAASELAKIEKSLTPKDDSEDVVQISCHECDSKL